MSSYQINGVGTSILMGLTLLLSGCGNDSKTSEINQLANITDEQAETPNYASTFTMAVEKNFPPYVFQDEYGQVTGFDAELMRAIADKGKFNIQFVIVDRKQAFDDLKKGKYNIFGSGVGINDNREEDFYFSEAYMKSEGAFATSDTKVRSHKDVKNKTIARQPSHYYYNKVKSKYGDNNKFMDFPTTFLAYAQIVNDTEIVAIDDVHVINYIKDSYASDMDVPEINVFPAFDGETKDIAFAIEKGNGDLLNKVNTGLEEVIKDGTYDSLYKKWFKQ